MVFFVKVDICMGNFPGDNIVDGNTLLKQFFLIERYLPAHNYEIKFQVRMKPEKVCRVFGACAVLHNISLTRNEPVWKMFVVYMFSKTNQCKFRILKENRMVDTLESISQEFSSTEIHV